MDEARILRSRLLAAGDEIDAGYSPPSEGTPTMIGQVFNGGSMPTSGDHYFLVHPVEIGGDECEGCTGTVVADTSTQEAVVVIGSRVPLAGDLLRCFRCGGRWVAGGGAGPPPPAGGCHLGCGCGVPDTVDVADGLYGASTATFDSGTNLWKWTVAYSFPGTATPLCAPATITLYFTADLISSCTYGYAWARDEITGCPNNDPITETNVRQVPGLSIATDSCTPFHGHGTTFGASNLGNGAASGSTTFDADIISDNCCVVDFATSCDGTSSLAGITVAYWTSSGKGTAVSSGTNPTGSAAVNNVAVTGTYWREIADPSGRFATNSGSVTVACGAKQVTALTPASGYRCFTPCPYPIAATLTASFGHPVYGPITYTYSGGNWVATVSYSFPGAGACGAKVVTITCTLNGTTGAYTESWKVDGSNCPDDAGATTHTATWTRNTLQCFVPSTSSFLIEFGIFPSNAADNAMYFSSSQTLDITE